MPSKDFILHNKSVLSGENCKNIITFFEGNSHLHKPGQRSKDTEMFLETVGKTPINSVLAQTLSVGIDEYQKEYSIWLRFRGVLGGYRQDRNPSLLRHRKHASVRPALRFGTRLIRI